MNENNLYVWQQQVVEKVRYSEDREDILVVAESGEGKTALLDHIESQQKVARDSFRGGADLDNLYGDESIVLLDEGGMMHDLHPLVNAMDDHPETQTVVVTVPACPPILMVEPRFDYVVRQQEDEE